MRKIAIVILIISSVLLSQTFQVGRQGAVVSASKLASDVGIKILKKGGTAIDAAIAVGFALAVVYPPAGKIGGGGVLVFCLPGGIFTKVCFWGKTSPEGH
nr:gamma-glutamyltransferase [Candidatus Neomarinimicrobiota bacterium]